jgi:short-subunit dehydrogenase
MSAHRNAWALVTGASSGIGTEFARQLASRQYNVVLTARREDRLRALASELESAHGVQTHVIVSDLATPGSAEILWQAVAEAGIPCTVLINNAGFGDRGNFSEADRKRTSQMMQLNVNSLVELTQLAVPGMLQRRSGYILNVASTAAFQPGPNMAVYFATKSFVLSFTEALHFELTGTGVSATTLCPGPTESEFFDTARMSGSRLFMRSLPSSAEVAALGLEAMFAGKRTVIHGFSNRMGSRMAKWMPRAIVLRVTQRLLA